MAAPALGQPDRGDAGQAARGAGSDGDAGPKAAAAGSGLRAARIGVVTGRTGPGDGRQMVASGVDTQRLVFNWNAIETRRPTGGDCSSAQYGGFQRFYDDFVAGQTELGIRLLPVIAGSPDYAAAKESALPRAEAFDEYRCFVRALVDRYGPGGELLETDLAPKPLHEWQVWNEPNVEFYAVDVDPRHYARVLKLTVDELRAGDPEARIIAAGMPEEPRRGLPIAPFLERTYRVPGVAERIDAVALHPYAENHRGVEGALIRLRRLMDRRLGARGTPIWITEIGWASHGPRRQFPVKGPSGQANQLARTLRSLSRPSQRRRFELGSIFWFSWRDAAEPSAGEGWDSYAGLYTKGGRPKRACERYVRFTDGGCAQIEDGGRRGLGGVLPSLGGLLFGSPTGIPSSPG